MSYELGHRVAWSHVVGPEHGARSIIKAQVVLARDASARLGTVVAPANDAGTHWEVKLDGDEESRVLTADEIVRVEE